MNTMQQLSHYIQLKIKFFFNPNFPRINDFKSALNLATYFAEHESLNLAKSIVQELEVKERSLPELPIVSVLYLILASSRYLSPNRTRKHSKRSAWPPLST